MAYLLIKKRGNTTTVLDIKQELHTKSFKKTDISIKS